MSAEERSNRKILPLDASRRTDLCSNSRCEPVGEDPRGDPAPCRSSIDRAELIRALKQELESLPDSRRDKVIEAKLRLSQGHYDRPEVRQEILLGLLRALRPRRREMPVPAPETKSTGDPAGP